VTLTRTVAVVGAGVTGLAASLYAALKGARVTLFEPGLPGGKVRSAELAGHELDLGPDSFLTRYPELMALIADLGLSQHLTYQLPGDVYLYCSEGRFLMPKKSVMGVPIDLKELKRAGILSGGGYFRLRRDRYARRHKGGDVTVAELVVPRLGEEAYRKLVAPLISSVYAARADSLSVASCAPELLASASAYGSLIKGARLAAKASERRAQPPFATLFPSMARLPQAILGRLQDFGSFQLVRSAVQAIAVDSEKAYLVSKDAEVKADAVILAVPAQEASRLLRGVDEDASVALSSIEYSSVAVATFAFKRPRLPMEPSRGILVTEDTGLLTRAVTFLSSKWPHLNLSDVRFLRASVGSFEDRRHLEMTDDEVVERVVEELREVADLREAPDSCLLTRWGDSFPRYLVGHGRLVTSIKHMAARHLGGRLALGGAWSGGIGLGARVREGLALASQAVS
jgi:oxygen-dependent protoporphyrinogen oxidase